MTFTVVWHPAQGYDITTDPPPPAVGLTVNVAYNAHYDVSTDGTGTVSGAVSLSVDNTVTASHSDNASGDGAGVSWGTGSTTAPSYHPSVTVPQNGVMTLDIPISLTTSASMTGDSCNSTNSAVVTVTPTVEDPYAILVVPDPRHAWQPMSSYNRLLFDGIPVSNGGGRLAFVDQNPPLVWRTRIDGATSMTQYVDATTYYSFGLGDCTVTPGTKASEGNDVIQPFTYTGLPSANDAFWQRNVQVIVNASDVFMDQSVRVGVFYLQGETNHPGPETRVTPNWYYYWDQTGAMYGVHEWGGDLDASGLTRYEPQAACWRSYICNGAELMSPGRGWGGACGIDWYAVVCRHEAKHLEQMTAMWGGGPVISLLDLDDDHLDDGAEPYLISGMQFLPWVQRTFDDDFGYGQDPLRDNEYYCCYYQEPWTNGSSDNMDWAAPGHQYGE
jgi:hypothetical protein